MTDKQIRALLEAADACETLADIDEGENLDVERLRDVAIVVRRLAERQPGVRPNRLT